nr:neutral zinc metallopeptidase [Kribbella sandramycini]
MPSGYSDNAGYYQDGHIYIVAELDLDLEKKDPELNRVFRAFLIAHEYGHHLQALTGVFAAKYERDATLNGVDARWQENRRMELQADCLGGAFLGAAKKSFGIDAHWVQRWNEVFTWFEDPASDHGQGTTRQTWAVKGLDAAGPAACNTYQAAPIEVR